MTSKSTSPQFARMPWYPRDFASSTRGWPLIARAVYRELLDAQWDMGGSQAAILPDDPEQLREICRATKAEWDTAWKFVAAKFPQVEGGRQNSRLEEHRRTAKEEFEARRKGANATNEKRWGNRRAATPERVANGSHSDSLSED